MDAFLYTAVVTFYVEDVVSQVQRIGCQPDRTTFFSHSSGQSRSWFAEQRKENKKGKFGTPPPTLLGRYGGNKIKAHGARNEENKTKI